jgi:dTMP kinase
MFIVFEGIDGSGKTTLSGRAADLLLSSGLSVHQARPKGELKSRLAQDIRTLARDPRNLDMSPHTELFLFIARDTQTVDTVIRPQLQEAEVVIADRYLYSAEVLCRARGQVPAEEIEIAVQTAARGLWPDLVIYCDVDIETSALRKSIDKMVNRKDIEDFGRKGLKGLGLRDAMRNVYLDMAAKNPDTWFVVDNAHASIEENALKIANRILKALGRPQISAPNLYPKHEMLIPSSDASLKEARSAFYDYIRRLIVSGRWGEAAFHLRSIDSEEAWQMRETLIPHVPAVVVCGLEPLFCHRALSMRKRLMHIVPGCTAESLNAEWADENDGAWEIRHTLSTVVPDDVAMTLGTLDTDRAWELRDRLIDESPGPVLSSLKALDCDRAWKMRNKWGKKKALPGLLKGLSYLDTDRAWEMREKNQKNAAPWFVLSLVGLESEKAWDLRARYLENATKLTVRSMSGSTDPRAWEMRRQAGPWAQEVLTTIKGIDTEEAWSLRRSLMDRWPGAAGKSVGMTLAQTPPGFDFLRELASRHPASPEVLHYLVKAIETEGGVPK